jgi:hypothetical protein
MWEQILIIAAALCVGSWIGAGFVIAAIKHQASVKMDRQLFIQDVDKWHKYEVTK